RIQDKIQADPNIQKRIERAIGTHLPLDARLDAVADLYLAVLEGRVACDFIEQVAPSYWNRAMEMAGSKFGPRSLDEEIGEGWSLMDTLEDPTALEELEAAAEAAWSDN